MRYFLKQTANVFGLFSRLGYCFLQLESPLDEIDSRVLVDLIGETLIGGESGSEKRCGMQCMRREWCKSYNHNSHFTTCELIITDYRLLNMSTGNVN